MNVDCDLPDGPSVDLLEVWPLGWQERVYLQNIHYWTTSKVTINSHQEAKQWINLHLSFP
jgi:hypothetical protein